MSDWDDDDYDPNEQLKAQLSEKIVTLGLENVKKEEPVRTNEPGETGKKDTNKASSSAAGRELSEQQKREAQLNSDAAAAMDLFGLAQDKGRKYEDLSKKEDFQKYAEELGEQIATRSDNPHYLLFVNTLVDQITKPMKKIQLEMVEKTVSDHLEVYRKKDAEEQKKVVELKAAKTTKKQTKKKIMEDTVEGEYDDYMDKYENY
jgi:hypothetical protein